MIKRKYVSPVAGRAIDTLYLLGSKEFYEICGQVPYHTYLIGNPNFIPQKLRSPLVMQGINTVVKDNLRVVPPVSVSGFKGGSKLVIPLSTSHAAFYANPETSTIGREFYSCDGPLSGIKAEEAFRKSINPLLTIGHTVQRVVSPIHMNEMGNSQDYAGKWFVHLPGDKEPIYFDFRIQRDQEDFYKLLTGIVSNLLIKNDFKPKSETGFAFDSVNFLPSMQSVDDLYNPDSTIIRKITIDSLISAGIDVSKRVPNVTRFFDEANPKYTLGVTHHVLTQNRGMVASHSFAEYDCVEYEASIPGEDPKKIHRFMGHLNENLDSVLSVIHLSEKPTSFAAMLDGYKPNLAGTYIIVPRYRQDQNEIFDFSKVEEQERFTESLLRHIKESCVLENVRNNLPSNLN